VRRRASALVEQGILTILSAGAAAASLGEAGTRVWRVAFLALLAAHCASFWIFPYFPSQDGPSHVYNAFVLARFERTPVFGEYYQLHLLPPAGNLLTQYVLAAMLQAASPLVAEKLLLSLYAALLFASFRYFLGAFTTHVDYFSPFAAVLAQNWFLYKGFWNFLFSVILFFLVAGYCGRRRSCWSPGALVLLLAGGFLLYAGHALSWAMGLLTAAFWTWPRLQAAAESRQAGPMTDRFWPAFWQAALPALVLLPPAVLFFAYLAQAQPNSPCLAEAPWRERFSILFSLGFLGTLAPQDPLLRKSLAVFFWTACLVAAAIGIRRRAFTWSGASLLILGLLCAAVTILGPDCALSGTHVRRRIAFYACIFLAGWLAAGLPRWPRRLWPVFPLVFSGFSLLTLAMSLPVWREWSARLTEVVRAGGPIRPAATVLMVDLQGSPSLPVNPYLHAAGLLSAKNIINLRNYEAATDHFLTRFRPERSPYPALGTLRQLESYPPAFDIGRYERETAGRVDYVLFVGRAGAEKGETVDDLVDRWYQPVVAASTLVSTLDGVYADFRLYQRERRPVSVGSGPLE
jgi:hypothetical protein